MLVVRLTQVLRLILVSSTKVLYLPIIIQNYCTINTSVYNLKKNSLASSLKPEPRRWQEKKHKIVHLVFVDLRSNLGH